MANQGFKKINEAATELQKASGKKLKKVKVMRFEEVTKSVYVLPRTEAVKRAAKLMRNKKGNPFASSQGESILKSEKRKKK